MAVVAGMKERKTMPNRQKSNNKKINKKINICGVCGSQSLSLSYIFLILYLQNGIEHEPASMEHIKRSDVFPKKALVSEDNNLRVPFPLLSGECAEYLGRTVDGVIVLSNYRLLIRCKESFSNVPLGLIESVEMREIFYLHANCKDATVVR